MCFIFLMLLMLLLCSYALEFYNFYNRGGAFLIIPVVNPYEFINKTRFNSNRKDLNRDFSNLITGIKRFTQVESRNYVKTLDDVLNDNKASLKVSVDYHCCYMGALLIPWAHTKVPIPTIHRNLFDEIANSLYKQFPDAIYGSVSETLWYTPDGTSMDYLYAKYDSLSMAYEGRYKEEENYLEEHIVWWKDIIRLY